MPDRYRNINKNITGRRVSPPGDRVEKIMNKKEIKKQFGGRSYWLNVLAISVLLALGIISGSVNYLAGDGGITFANVFWSFIHLAAWGTWGWFAISGRAAGHPSRVLYSVWFALPAASATALLVASFIPASADLFATAAGGTIAACLVACCLPMAGFGFFGSTGYVANDIVILALSLLMLLLPRIAATARSRKAKKRS